LEWLRVGIILNWESLVKEDWIKPESESRHWLLLLLCDHFYSAKIARCSKCI